MASDNNNQQDLLREIQELRLKVAELEIIKRQYNWTEERLKAEKERAQNYLDIAGVIIVALDRQGLVTLINKKGSEILGYQQKEIIGKNWFENFIPLRMRESTYSVFCQLIEGKIELSEYFENPIITKNGEERIVYWHNALVRDEKGVVVGTLSSGEDITERKRLEEARLQNLEFYRSLVRTSPDAIFLFDREAKLIMVNQRAADLFDFEKKEEAIGRSVFDFVAKKDKQRAERDFQYLKGKGSIAGVEYSLLKKEGQMFIGELNSTVIRDAYGNIQALMAVVRDISQRKQAEEALRDAIVHERTVKALQESKDYLDKIINSVADPLFVKDRKHRWVLLNDACCKFIGHSRQELLGKSDYDYFPKEQADVFWNRDEIVFETGKENINEEAFTDAQKVLHTIVTKKTLYVNAKGEKFIVGIIRDITQEKILEQERLKRRQAEAELRERHIIQKTLADSERQHRMIFDSMADAIHVVGRDLRIIVANEHLKQWLKGFGLYSKVAGKTVFEAFPFLPKSVGDEYEKVFTTGAMVVTEETTLVKGKAIITETRKIPVFREKRVEQVVTVIRDITERRRAHEELRKSEGRLRTIFEAASNVSFIIADAASPDLKIIEFSPGAEAIFGYKRQEMIGKSVSCVHIREDVALFAEVHRKMKEGKKGFQGTVTLVRKSGEKFPALFSTYPLLDEKANVYAVLGVAIDISARRKAEKALLYSKFVFDHMHDIALWIDASGKLSYVNEAACKRLGYSRKELLDMKIFDIDINFPPDLWESRWKEIKRKKSDVLETQFSTKKGIVFPVELSGNYMECDGQEYLCVIVRDLSERERAEEALRQSEQDKTMILDTLSELVVYHDTKMRILWANKAAREDAGFSHEQLVGRCCYEIWQNRRSPCKDCPVERALKTGHYEQGQVYSPEGRCWFMRAYPVKDITGKVSGVVEVGLDVSQQKKAEQESRLNLERSQRILEETVIALAATAERRDPYTAGHQRRVAQLACAIAQELKLDTAVIEGIRMAAIIHDVGKVYVPSEILSKPSKLTELEMSIIKTHPQIGYDILEPIEFPWPVALIVLQHHERLDGSGYPRGITDKDILFEAKVLMVSDVVEAMASHRPYRAAIGINEALNEITNNKNTLYDSRVVDTCVKLFRKKKFTFD